MKGPGAVLCLLAAGAGLWLASGLGVSNVAAVHRPKSHPAIPKRVPSPLDSAAELAASGRVGAAVAAYDTYIADHKDSKDKTVQDVVATARISKGFALAKGKKYEEARKTLLEAEKEYRGTGRMVPQEGGAKDEAAYQAAVCLLAEGKKAEGKKELQRFIDRYPDSPNTNGAYKRLLQLTTGKERDAMAAKLDKIAQARGERYALEVAKCGPKAIAYLARLLGKPVPTEDALVRACKTDKTGTSMAGALGGLKLIGETGYGYALNRKDFQSIPTPAVWLKGDHFYVVLQVSASQATVYDPMTRSQSDLELPSLSDNAFLANVLTLKKPALSKG